MVTEALSALWCDDENCKGWERCRTTIAIFQSSTRTAGVGIAGCLRADLVDLLVERLENYERGNLRYSKKLTGIHPRLDKVELQFESGHWDVEDLAIEADGIHSTVANVLNIDDETSPIYSGANIFYGKIPRPDKIEFLHEHPIFQQQSIVNGPRTVEFSAPRWRWWQKDVYLGQYLCVRKSAI